MLTVPNKPKTPTRTLRVSDDLWQQALKKAEARGETLSDVMRKALQRYVSRP